MAFDNLLPVIIKTIYASDDKQYNRFLNCVGPSISGLRQCIGSFSIEMQGYVTLCQSWAVECISMTFASCIDCYALNVLRYLHD